MVSVTHLLYVRTTLFATDPREFPERATSTLLHMTSFGPGAKFQMSGFDPAQMGFIAGVTVVWSQTFPAFPELQRRSGVHCRESPQISAV